MPPRILVINPNSTQAVTEGIDRALAPLRIAGGPEFECVTLREGPPGIQSQRDVHGVIGPLTRLIAVSAELLELLVEVIIDAGAA